MDYVGKTIASPRKKKFVRKLSGRVPEIESELDNLKRSLLAIYSVVLSIRAGH